MNATDYQRQAARTLIDKPDFELTSQEKEILYDCIELGATAGKVNEVYKKGVLHKHGFDKMAFLNALSAVSFAVAHLINAVSDEDQNFGDGIFTNSQIMTAWNTVGLIGETGEISEMVTRFLAEDEPIDLDKAKKEAGDCAWYLAAFCTKLGLDLGDVMAANIEKLKVRYPTGYKSADSVARVDTVKSSESMAFDTYVRGTWGGFDEMPAKESAT